MRSACRLEGFKSLQLSTQTPEFVGRNTSVMIKKVKKIQLTVRVSNAHSHLSAKGVWNYGLRFYLHYPVRAESHWNFVTTKLQYWQSDSQRTRLIFTHTHTAELWSVCLWVCSSCQLSLCLSDILLVTHTLHCVITLRCTDSLDLISTSCKRWNVFAFNTRGLVLFQFAFLQILVAVDQFLKLLWSSSVCWCHRVAVWFWNCLKFKGNYAVTVWIMLFCSARVYTNALEQPMR